ncbi:unnamed protein product [Gordionus sp. m RMFG-2023]|uniref:cAMP-dependent protein kinase catalytic subunit alpha-like n=1 Tax=Gordionus sp. m RMFG-2023 TaxID=3053472 RepID=UPI0030E35E41
MGNQSSKDTSKEDGPNYNYDGDDDFKGNYSEAASAGNGKSSWSDKLSLVASGKARREKKLKEWMEHARADFEIKWEAYSQGGPGSQRRLSYMKYSSNVTALVDEHYNKVESGGGSKGLHVSVVKLADFDLIRTLGEGSFGRVVLGRYRDPNRYLAIKIQNKVKIARMKQAKSVLNEKKVLHCMGDFPFVVKLFYSFKDNSYLYLVMEYVAGGELFTHLRRSGHFKEEMAAFYGAQVILALEYLHSVDIIYRDIKPENILLDPTNGYLKLTDFGFVTRIGVGRRMRTYTFCGTPDYMAPEIVSNKGYGKGADWWALGVLIYEMCAGYAPFTGPARPANNVEPQTDLFKAITSGQYSPFPSHFSTHLKDLLTNLLRLEVVRRYGSLSRGVGDIMCHGWFEGTGKPGPALKRSWNAIWSRRAKADFIPKSKGAGDTSQFDPSLREIPLEISDRNECSDLFAEF